VFATKPVPAVGGLLAVGHENARPEELYFLWASTFRRSGCQKSKSGLEYLLTIPVTRPKLKTAILKVLNE
jgi:hypothetical protein